MLFLEMMWKQKISRWTHESEALSEIFLSSFPFAIRRLHYLCIHLPVNVNVRRVTQFVLYQHNHFVPFTWAENFSAKQTLMVSLFSIRFTSCRFGKLLPLHFLHSYTSSSVSHHFLPLQALRSPLFLHITEVQLVRFISDFLSWYSSVNALLLPFNKNERF